MTEKSSYIIKGRNTHRLVAMIAVKGLLRNCSPLSIGFGDGKRSDADILRWPDSEEPYLPASAIAGALRNAEVDTARDEYQYLWGTVQSKVEQTIASHLYFSDCRLKNGQNPIKTQIRDGVAIARETGIAENGQKYDYEVLEPGHEFNFKLECAVRSGKDVSKISEEISRILSLIASDSFSIGKFTNHGFGQMEWSTDPSIRIFDFVINEDDRKEWFEYLESGDFKKGFKPVLIDPDPLSTGWRLTANCKLKTPMIIATYSEGADEVDKRHITSAGSPVLPAKSLRGSLRRRAWHILMALGAVELVADKMIAELFGEAVHQGTEHSAFKGNLLIKELMIQGTKPIIQDRIRIDRFTGAVQHGAKFESEPIWPVEDTSLDIELKLHRFAEEEHWQAGLLLHLIKDLGNGDLAVGGEKNVGRGIMELNSMTFSSGGTESLAWNREEALSKEMSDEASSFQKALKTRIDQAT